MIGLKHVPAANTLTWFDNFRSTYPDAEARRKRATEFIPVDGMVEAVEFQPTRIALSALWADPEFGKQSLRETANYLCDIGVTVRYNAQQRVALFRGLSAEALRGATVEPPANGFSVRIGTTVPDKEGMGTISWGTNKPSYTWMTKHGVSSDTPSLRFAASIDTTGTRELTQKPTGEVNVTDQAGIPFYAGQVCLHEDPGLYRQSRQVGGSNNLVFGDYHVAEALENLTRHADDLQLPISSILKLDGII